MVARGASARVSTMQHANLPDWTAAHPVAWGAFAAPLIAVVGFGLFGFQLWILLVSAIFGLGNWFVHRPDGPAHRWRRRIVERFPPRK